MWKICLLVAVLQTIINETNGKGLERNPQQNISQGRYRREAAVQEPTVVSKTITGNVVSAVVQTSTPNFEKVLFPSSDQTDAPKFSDKTLAPTTTETPTSESTELSKPDKPKTHSLFDCYQEDIQPISYEISSSPQWKLLTFNAETNITIKVMKQCNTLTLPKNALTIKDVTLMSLESQTMLELNLALGDSTNLTLQFVTPVPAGNYKLMVKYSGIINVVPQGLIEKSDGSLTGIIITAPQGSYDFGYTAVKMNFPCWNSPEVKAKFSIAIEYLPNSKTLSNMHQTAYSYNDKKQMMTNFAQSPLFSMNEISFLLSNYENLECYAIKPHIFCSNSVHEFKVDQMIDNIQAITNLPHSQSPLQRLHMVILRKYDLLPDSLQILQCGLIITIHNQLVLSAILTSYGIAYQWFNCLVTPSESSHKWLSTGLATYYGTKIIPDEVYKNHKMDINIVERMEVMIYNSDPIITAIISHVKDTNAIHDRAIQMVLDHKASSIIRMMASAISEIKLNAAVENYLKNNLHHTTTSTDFIHEIKSVTNGDAIPDIEEIIKNWLNMRSLPSVTVARNNKTGIVTITQNPLKISNPLRARLYNEILMNEYESSPESADERFWIPINFVTHDELLFNGFDDVTVTHWLSPNEKSIVIPKIGMNKWIIVNKQRFGYYRMNYDAESWRSIIKTLNSGRFNLIDRYNRAQLIDDAFSFLEAGQLDYEIIFDLIEYLGQETDYVTWLIAERHIMRMFSTLLESPDHNFKEYMMHLSKKIADEEFSDFGFPYLHSTYPQLLTAFCRWGSTSCHTQLLRIYRDRLVNSDSDLDPIEYRLDDDSAQLSNLILCAGGKSITDNQTWNELEDQWQTNSLVLNIIACRTDKAMVKKFFSAVVKSPAVSSKTFFYIINLFVINNMESNIFPILYDVLRESLKEIKTSNNMSGPDLDLVLELINVIVSIKTPTNPPFHTLRLFFKQNEARLETYFGRQEIQKYLLRTEIDNLDLSLPVFNRFRKI